MILLSSTLSFLKEIQFSTLLRVLVLLMQSKKAAETITALSYYETETTELATFCIADLIILSPGVMDALMTARGPCPANHRTSVPHISVL